MNDACKSFAGGTLKTSVKKGLPTSFAIPSEIRTIATAFVELQERRHIADYDLTFRFRRSAALGLIQQADTAIRQFRQLTMLDEKKFFLACLWAWNTLGKR